MDERLDLDALQRRIDVIDNVGVSVGEQQQMLDELRATRRPAVKPWPKNAVPLCDCGGAPVHTNARHIHWPRGTDFAGEPVAGECGDDDTSDLR